MNAPTLELTGNQTTLRVCSYNIHKGFNTGNRRFLLKKIREAIRLSHADILFLQEVVGENNHNARKIPEWIPESQFEFLADSVWPHHAYGRNAVYDHGHHGNAILSKYNLLEDNNFDLSILPKSHRGVLHTRTMDNLQLFCVHFGLLSAERRVQIKRLIKIIESRTSEHDAIIIAGDFNDWQSKLGKYLSDALMLKEALSTSAGKPVATFPAYAPMLPMDRIYFRGLELVTAKVLTGAPWKQLSDHCAVYAEFSTTKRPFINTGESNKG